MSDHEGMSTSVAVKRAEALMQLPQLDEGDIEALANLIELVQQDTSKDVTQDQYLRSTALTMAIQWTLSNSRGGPGLFPQMLQDTTEAFYSYLKTGKPLDESVKK